MALNRKGFTGVVDAMFFIALIGIAVAVLAGGTAQEGYVPDYDASSFCDEAFRSKVTCAEFGMDIEDGRVHPVADLTAASVAAGDGSAETYFGRLLDGVFGRPGAYLMTIGFGGDSVSVGSGGGTETYGFSSDYTSCFGVVHVELFLY
ncbi:hypothetical protein [Methanomethylophilus alvi]|uniref:hypothetical protein n=1 Tax=Methanomethylophilus alvi TaxID=1291540 RepID=UPI0037DC8900